MALDPKKVVKKAADRKMAQAAAKKVAKKLNDKKKGF